MKSKILLSIVIAIALFVVFYYVLKFVFITSLIIAGAIIILPILYFTFKSGSSSS